MSKSKPVSVPVPASVSNLPAFSGYSPALEDLDQSAIFLAYLTFLGDLGQTALATNTPQHLVAQLEAREDWRAKLVNLHTFKEKGDQGGFEQAINRTVNFVQAVRLRRLIDLALRRMLQDPTPDAVFGYFEGYDKHGHKITNIRPLMDLVKAAETAQHMTYRALGDRAEEPVAQMAGHSPQSQVMSMQRALAALNAIPGESAVGAVKEEILALSEPPKEDFDPRGQLLERAMHITKPNEEPPAPPVH